jgi:hypothetical protein
MRIDVDSHLDPPMSHPETVMLSNFRTCNSPEPKPVKVHRLTVICAWCGVVKQRGTSLHLVSHGICEPCAERWRLQNSRPALMKPIASRWDCRECDFVVNDWDGVAESCDRLIGEGCIRKDRRQPWERK